MSAGLGAGAVPPAAPAPSAEVDLAATPLPRLLDGLDPRTRDILMEIEVVRYGRGIPGWPDDKPFSRLRSTARFAGEAFFVQHEIEDLSIQRPPQHETIAFDGHRTYVRGEHTPGWLITSRRFILPPDLRQLGFVGQTGLGLGWLAAEGRDLQDDLADAVEIDRRTEDGRLHVAFAFRRADGRPLDRGQFEMVLDRRDGFTRLLAVGDRSTEPRPDGSMAVVRRSGIRAVAWETTPDGLHLPRESEYLMEQTPLAGSSISSRSTLTLHEARTASAEETLELIRAFARPRPGETVFDTDLRLQFKTGETRFLLEGASYEAVTPLTDVPGDTVQEILRQARRLDGGWRESGAVPGGGASPAPLNPVDDTLRWILLSFGAACIVAGLVIWRRA